MNKSEHTQTEVREVITYLTLAYNSRYKVLNNLDGDNNFVAGLFPDIMLQDQSGNLLFIIEVKRNGNIAQCIQQWKNVPTIPAPLYIIVPENDLSNAQSIAQVVGFEVRFGTYIIDPNTRNVSVKL